MASIIKRGDAWQVRWREGGRNRARTCPDHGTAKRLAREVERSAALGERWQPAGAAQAPTVSEALEAYVLDVGRALAPRTAHRYAGELDLFRAFLGRRAGEGLGILSQALLGDFWTWLEVGLHDRPRALVTKRKIAETVHRWWRWCAEQDAFEAHTPKPRSVRLPRAVASRTVAPTWAEMDRVVHALTGWRRRLALVLRFTGLRVSQAMGLRWADVDLEAGHLVVRPELGKSPSERAGRVVPISEHLVAELRTWERSEDWLIAVGERVTVERDRAARAEMMRRAWERSGVRREVWERRPQHAFRKGLRSGLARLGADRDAIEYLIGHDLGLVGTYTDPSALPLRDAVALIPPVRSSDDA